MDFYVATFLTVEHSYKVLEMPCFLNGTSLPFWLSPLVNSASSSFLLLLIHLFACCFCSSPHTFLWLFFGRLSNTSMHEVHEIFTHMVFASASVIFLLEEIIRLSRGVKTFLFSFHLFNVIWGKRFEKWIDKTVFLGTTTPSNFDCFFVIRRQKFKMFCIFIPHATAGQKRRKKQFPSLAGN